MSADHVRYADWDAAYAIGALSGRERREFEEHLEGCAQCRQAIAELASTVALLSRLTPEDVRAMEAGAHDQDAQADAAVRAQISVLDRSRRRRRSTWWAAAAAAVAIVVAGVSVPLTIAALAPPAASFALEDVADVPLSASVRLTEAGWGTRIDLDCRYAGAVYGGPPGGWEYALAVVDEDGAAATVSTWRAGPGSHARLSAATATPLPGIRAIEIRSADGTVLMRHTLPR